MASEEMVDRGGEPVLKREEVVKPSPVPKFIAAVVILFAVFSVWRGIVADNEREEQQERIQAVVAENARVAEQLELEIERAKREQNRLADLLAGLLTIESPEERRELIRDFIRESRQVEMANDAEDARAEEERRDEGGDTVSSPRPSPTPE